MSLKFHITCHNGSARVTINITIELYNKKMSLICPGTVQACLSPLSPATYSHTHSTDGREEGEREQNLRAKLLPINNYNYIHMLCEMRRKKETSKVKQTNKAKQHSTPKAVIFPKKNELHVHVVSVVVIY